MCIYIYIEVCHYVCDDMYYIYMHDIMLSYIFLYAVITDNYMDQH